MSSRARIQSGLRNTDAKRSPSSSGRAWWGSTKRLTNSPTNAKGGPTHGWASRWISARPNKDVRRSHRSLNARGGSSDLAQPVHRCQPGSLAGSELWEFELWASPTAVMRAVLSWSSATTCCQNPTIHPAFYRMLINSQLWESGSQLWEFDSKLWGFELKSALNTE
jgi:hypothetical protein